MLAFIPIDVIEVIVVLTSCNRTFKQLSRLISQLQDIKRSARITSKMTNRFYNRGILLYRNHINDLDERYLSDKPNTIIGFSTYYYPNNTNMCWNSKMGRNKNLPYYVSSLGERRFLQNNNVKGNAMLEYIFNSSHISMTFNKIIVDGKHFMLVINTLGYRCRDSIDKNGNRSHKNVIIKNILKDEKQ